MPPRKRKDPRGFVNIDTGYLDNPKIDQLIEISQTAVFMHLKSLFYCGEHLTDGHAPAKKIMRLLGGTDDDVESLVEMGLWHNTNHRCEECPQPRKGMIYVHDYLDHNRSKAEAEKQAEAGKKAAESRWRNNRRNQQPTQEPTPPDDGF